MAPSLVFEHWQAEFDGLYAERKSFVLAMHPEVIGRPSRIPLLGRLIEHIQAHDNVWFGRCDEVASALVSKL
jgi:peptidoglycan/xylan/chitin deacetylase (PgdA/CDA1 family)